MSTESILGEGGREKDPGLLNFCYATHLQYTTAVRKGWCPVFTPAYVLMLFYIIFVLFVCLFGIKYTTSGPVVAPVMINAHETLGNVQLLSLVA